MFKSYKISQIIPNEDQSNPFQRTLFPLPIPAKPHSPTSNPIPPTTTSSNPFPSILPPGAPPVDCCSKLAVVVVSVVVTLGGVNSENDASVLVPSSVTVSTAVADAGPNGVKLGNEGLDTVRPGTMMLGAVRLGTTIVGAAEKEENWNAFAVHRPSDA